MDGAVPTAESSSVSDPLDRVPRTTARGDVSIWERIRLRVEDRLGVVETQAHRMLQRALEPAEVEVAHRAATALARDLWRLDLTAIAQLARQLVTRLSGDGLQSADAVHIAGITEDIRTLLSSAMAQQQTTVSSRGTILAIGSPSEQFDAICWVLASRGHGVRHHAGSLVSLPDAPVGILVSIDRFTMATRALLQALSETWPAPIVALYGDPHPDTLRELAARCTAIMPASASADRVYAEFARHESVREMRPTVYAHGRVPQDAGRRLRGHGFRIRRAREIDALPKLLEEEVGAVVFGSSLAPTEVIAISHVIRATPTVRRAPLVWLTSVPNEGIEEAHRLGILPVTELTDGVVSRLRGMVRAIAADQKEDERASSAILAWSAARVLIDRALVAAHRSGRSVVTVVIQLRPRLDPERLQQTLAALGREFRRGDILGLQNDRTVVIVLPGVSRQVVTRRLMEMMDRLDLTDRSHGAAVAMFPGDGRSADELVQAAERARLLARECGGPMVVSTAWRPEEQQAADVLIVQSDVALGRMLVSLIQAQGRRTKLFDDGLAALDWLTTRAAAEVPKLLLIDLDTAGLDGLGLVRRLRPSGILTQLNVLLMTARFSESDLRVALDLGVAEVVHKPFSSTLLLHRVNRLLASH